MELKNKAHFYGHVCGTPLTNSSTSANSSAYTSNLNYWQNFYWNPSTPKAHSGGNSIKQISQHGLKKSTNTEDNKGYLLHCLLFHLVSASLRYRPNHRPAKVTNSSYSFLDLALPNTGKMSAMAQTARPPPGAELLEVAILKKPRYTTEKQTHNFWKRP